MTKYPWTRIQSEPIWNLASSCYHALGMPYHSMEHHIYRLYQHAAETLEIPYDYNLDIAILTHDVVQNGHEDDEALSAKWLADNMAPPPYAAIMHIMRTAFHMPGNDDRMALLDLIDFTCPEARRANTELLRQEAALKGVGDEQFKASTSAYLGRLSDRIRGGLMTGPRSDNAGLWLQIASGVDSTIKELRAKKADPEITAL